jgi:xanthine/CO dehydrogenase XdhC/CoxF family maturation factor
VKREAYEELHRLLVAGDPVVLATVTRTSAESGIATRLGAELLALPDGRVLGRIRIGSRGRA